MTSRRFQIALTALLAFGLVSLDGSTAKALNEADCKAMAEIGAGAHRLKKNPDGSWKSLVIVGQATISKSLGSKGILVAKKRAGVNASGEFSKFLKQNASIKQTANDVAIVSIADGVESGKSEDVFTEVGEVTAQQQLRGMTPICSDRDMELMQFTIVYGWSPVNAGLAAQAEGINNAEASTTTATTGTAGKVSVSELNAGSNTAVSGDAADF